MYLRERAVGWYTKTSHTRNRALFLVKCASGLRLVAGSSTLLVVLGLSTGFATLDVSFSLSLDIALTVRKDAV